MCEREGENIIMVSLVVKEMGFVVCVLGGGHDSGCLTFSLICLLAPGT